jgi:hypothetical protein
VAVAGHPLSLCRIAVLLFVTICTWQVTRKVHSPMLSLLVTPHGPSEAVGRCDVRWARTAGPCTYADGDELWAVFGCGMASVSCYWHGAALST